MAFVPDGAHLYLFGIPAGRFGAVKLARVPQDRVLDRRAYLYLSSFQDDQPQWTPDEAHAVAIVPAPAGEPSVVRNDFLGRWTMTYLDHNASAIVMREAEELWGPWSPPQAVVRAAQYPALYGGYMHPWLLERNGEIVHFTISRWVPYNVFLMRARLVRS